MCYARLAALGLGLALTLVAASPALAKDDARGRCVREAARAGLIGRGLNPGQANFVVGTARSDDFSGRATAGRDVFCGFGGNDFIDGLDEGDVFLGGEDDDQVHEIRGGTFLGGEGGDHVNTMQRGTFSGGRGGDNVIFQNGGTVNGDPDDDTVAILRGGTFNGGPGADSVITPQGGTFNQD
jgi:hypothetical protein